MGRTMMRFPALISLFLATTAVANLCPGWLQDPCMPGCIVLHCGNVMETCMQDKSCKSNLWSTMSCMATHDQKNITAQTACMVPDDPKRDDAFNCMIEQHHCIKLPDNNPHYPACRDSEVPGDANMSLTNIAK